MLRLVIVVVCGTLSGAVLLNEDSLEQSRVDALEARLNALENQMSQCRKFHTSFMKPFNLTPEQSRIDALETPLNAPENQMSQCPCSEVRPAFMAGLTSDIVHCSKGQAVIFDSVKLNIGGGYTNRHGVFTAPVTGAYQFTVSLSLDNGYFQVDLVKNNASNPIGYLFEDTDHWEKLTTSVLTHMDAGDEVWLTCMHDSKISGSLNHVHGGAGDYHSHMSGFLVSEGKGGNPLEIVG